MKLLQPESTFQKTAHQMTDMSSQYSSNIHFDSSDKESFIQQHLQILKQYRHREMLQVHMLNFTPTGRLEQAGDVVVSGLFI